MTRGRAVAAFLLCSACEKPAPPARTSPSVPPPSISASSPTLAAAESLYFRAEYDSAAAVWKRELDDAALDNDSLRQATVLMWLGLTAWRQGDNPTARALGEKSLDLKKKLSGNSDQSRSYNALGLVARDEGRLRDAAVLFNEAMNTAGAVADTPGVSRAAANIALIHLELGDFEKAKQGFQAARDAGRALGDERVEGNALNNLGMLTIRLGDPSAAIPLINDALARYRSIEYSTGEQNSLAQLATAYELLGDPQRALSLLDSASRLARAANMRTEEASNLRLTGQVYQSMGDHRRALALFARAATLSRALGLNQEVATTLRSEAVSHLELGRVDLARARTLEAWRLHRDQGALWEQLQDLLMLAELATIARDDGEASARLADARRISQTVGAPSGRSDVALSEARIAERRNDWQQVLRSIASARSQLGAARADIAWEPAALRARAFARLGLLDSAAESGRVAIESAERVRGRISSAGLRTGFTSARAALYADQVMVLLRLGRTAEAFEVADAARGRALLEHLLQAREGIEGSSPTSRDIVKGEALLRQIDELMSLLEEVERTPKAERSLDDRALSELSERVIAAEREYAMLVDRVATDDPRRAALLGIRRGSASEIQRVLRPHEALVEYLVAGDRLFAFVVASRGVRRVEIPVGDSALSLRVRLMRELLKRRGDDSAAVMTSLTNLHRILIEPLERMRLLAGIRHIVLVPHSSLAYLPFAALRSGQGKYLIERYSILTLPSAGALASLRGTSSSSPERNDATGGAVLAPFTRALPATRAEARSVSAAVPGTKTFLDGEASELAFRQAASANRLLHLATHGTLNVQNPLFSRLELSRIGTKAPEGSANDGRLSVHELIGMKTSSPLVFLSGCETALGSAWSNDFVRGEDYATLSQALLYSGTRNAVATLWRINDESAGVFARHFYSQLGRLSPPEALAAAQQKMLIDSRYRHPYHWAAYQVAGSGNRIALKQRWWGFFARWFG